MSPRQYTSVSPISSRTALSASRLECMSEMNADFAYSSPYLPSEMRSLITLLRGRTHPDVPPPRFWNDFLDLGIILEFC